MKYFPLFLLIIALVATTFIPQATFARGGSGSGNDDSHYSSDDSDDDESEEEDDSDDSDDSDSSDGSDEKNDSSNDNSSSALEVEADVFTDTTIVKVEQNDTKTIFETNADTRNEVINVVADRFDLTTREVEAVLDFEVENRTSRVKERAEIGSVRSNDNRKCDDNTSSSTLEIEADVFTNTTIIKVERNNAVSVFETTADTRNEVINVVADRFDLTTREVEAVLDFEVEDRRSRTTDSDSSVSSDDNCDGSSDDDKSEMSGTGISNGNTDAELRAKIAKLQELIQALIKLFNTQFGGNL